MAKKNSLSGVIDSVGEYFAKLPAMPKGGRDFFVMILPWAALILGGLGVLGAISSFGLFSYFSPYMYYGGTSFVGRGVIVIVLGLVSSVLLLMAFSPLSKKKERGWNLVYYGQALGLVSNIVMFSVGGILVTLLGFYILYQIRSYYK